jgi:hypothetical protein
MSCEGFIGAFTELPNGCYKFQKTFQNFTSTIKCMAATNKARKSVPRKTSLRMKKFIESVIQEVEETGIDDQYAIDEAETTSASVTDSAVLARTRRQPSA